MLTPFGPTVLERQVTILWGQYVVHWFLWEAIRELSRPLLFRELLLPFLCLSSLVLGFLTILNVRNAAFKPEVPWICDTWETSLHFIDSPLPLVSKHFHCLQCCVANDHQKIDSDIQTEDTNEGIATQVVLGVLVLDEVCEGEEECGDRKCARFVKELHSHLLMHWFVAYQVDKWSEIQDHKEEELNSSCCAVWGHQKDQGNQEVSPHHEDTQIQQLACV